ncbi:hypothetical protein [Nocardioides donggukensis]|uniref:Uncharacterized protein n=1 Tax=Nocardioides donggukensis TaxID=2774019 RepID=A0A927K8Z0_9ACTN|nr:hypothetical protein [Nocardioides donggukensis]MBD8869951.1 hypothetical protein [Nocardioides donggukensis]
MPAPGAASTPGGAVARGILRLVVLGGLAVLALSWAGPDEPLGNRRFLWGLAGLLLLLAAWGLVETLREVSRLVQRR